MGGCTAQLRGALSEGRACTENTSAGSAAAARATPVGGVLPGALVLSTPQCAAPSVARGWLLHSRMIPPVRRMAPVLGESLDLDYRR
jgi:hypothetical protein